MKVRNGFVSNSSSSSFIVFFKNRIENREKVLEYIENHKECVGYLEDTRYGDRLYFDIKEDLRDDILKYKDSIKSLPYIVENFSTLGEDFRITEDMVNGTVIVQYGYDGEDCDTYIPYEEMYWDYGLEDIIYFLFSDLPEDEYKKISEKYAGETYN